MADLAGSLRGRPTLGETPESAGDGELKDVATLAETPEATGDAANQPLSGTAATGGGATVVRTVPRLIRDNP